MLTHELQVQISKKNTYFKKKKKRYIYNGKHHQSPALLLTHLNEDFLNQIYTDYNLSLQGLNNKKIFS